MLWLHYVPLAFPIVAAIALLVSALLRARGCPHAAEIVERAAELFQIHPHGPSFRDQVDDAAKSPEAQALLEAVARGASADGHPHAQELAQIVAETLHGHAHGQDLATALFSAIETPDARALLTSLLTRAAKAPGAES